MATGICQPSRKFDQIDRLGREAVDRAERPLAHKKA